MLPQPFPKLFTIILIYCFHLNEFVYYDKRLLSRKIFGRFGRIEFPNMAVRRGRNGRNLMAKFYYLFLLFKPSFPTNLHFSCTSLLSFPHWFSYRLVSSIYLIFCLASLRLLVRRQDKRKLQSDTVAYSLSCRWRQIPPTDSRLTSNLLLISLQIMRPECFRPQWIHTSRIFN
jgi:hypothetical protein